MRTWTVQPPLAVGVVGTGPVDLSLATGVLNSPPGYDLPGGAGYLLNRAYEWFAEAANSAASEAERREHIIGAVSSFNNLGVWCMTRNEEPDAGQRAYEALERAEALARAYLADTELLGGILFNLGELLREAGHPDESAAKLEEAAILGVQ